jgi:predicted ABC-type ATPase
VCGMVDQESGEPERRILIIAGPNGAGKTTFAREFLPNEANCPLFVNADLIAAGLSPFAPERESVIASRLMLDRIRDLVSRRETFGIATTLAGKTYARMIPDWRKAGYDVSLLFLSLSSVDVAISRVADRVRQGVHSIPDAVTRRRFIAGRLDFDELYRRLVDHRALFDNSQLNSVLVASGDNHER